MSEKPLLRGLVVVGGYDQHGVGPQRLRGAAAADGVLGVVAARPDHDGDPARSLLHGKGHKGLPLKYITGSMFA